MSDYLNSLVTRTLRLAPVVQPRPASLFEPVAAGPISEPAFEVSENRSTQETPAPPLRVLAELPDAPLNNTPNTFSKDSRQEVLPPLAKSTTLLPAQATPPSPFTVSAKQVIHEVSVPDVTPTRNDRESTSSNDARPTPTLIRPEVRIFSSHSDSETVQPSLTTPPLAPVLPYTARADSAPRSRNLNAQPTEPAEAPGTVVVTIGRVDVRAIFTPPQPAPRANRTQSQALSLDEYLKQRSEGRR